MKIGIIGVSLSRKTDLFNPRKKTLLLVTEEKNEKRERERKPVLRIIIGILAFCPEQYKDSNGNHGNDILMD